MKKTMITKARLFKVLDILTNYSDEDHPIKMHFIISKLEEHGIVSSKYAIYDDIKTLNELGYDIIFIRNYGYYLNGKYDNAELKILIDALCSASFLSVDKTNMMIDKLLDDTSIHQRKEFRTNLYLNNNKVLDNKIIYNIDALKNAITNNLSISFHYFDLDITKEKIYRKNKKLYTLIPYSLIIQNQHYYLIAYSPKYETFTHYRVDKMENIKTKDSIVKKNFDVNEYAVRFIDMYINEKTSVTLKCKRSHSNAIIDKFSTNILLIEVSDDYFIFNINIDPSITFISWLITYKNEIEVLKPQSLIDDILSTIKPIVDLYDS